MARTSALPPHLGEKDATWLLETLINRELLVQEARRHGLDTSHVVRLEFGRALDGKLRDTLFEQAVVATVQVSEADLLEAFEQGPLGQRYEDRVAHIAVATLQEAEALRARHLAGEEFADLARQYSLDEASAVLGGEIGVWVQGEMLGPVAEHLWSLGRPT